MAGVLLKTIVVFCEVVDVPVTFPVTFPVRAPENAPENVVAVTVPVEGVTKIVETADIAAPATEDV